MKNKTKTTKKIKAPVLSRLTLKTFIIIVALTVFVSVLMSVKYYYDALQMGNTFRFALYTLYPLVTILGPLLAFGAVYMISKEKVTKLWRVSKAAIIATIAAMFQSLITPIAMTTLSGYIGYGANPPTVLSYMPMYAIEVLPVILAVILAVILSVVISKSQARNVSDASPLMQKLFVAGVLIVGLGQPIANSIQLMNDQQSTPLTTVMFDFLMSFVVPLIVLGILFLVIARRRGILERTFTTLFYSVMGVSLFIAFSPIPYLFSDPRQASFDSGWVSTYLPGVMALAVFIGIVVWHKIKKVI